MAHTYDVIIVGAGPAGLMAARTLDKARVDYLLIDAKKHLGLPLKCAEGISEKGFLELFGHKNYPFIRNTVHQHVIRYKDFERRLNADFLQLDRPRFEEWLGKGLKISLDCRLEDIKLHKDHAEVLTSKGVMYSDMVILSHGANYNIQKNLGLISKNPKIAIAYGGIYKDYKLPKDSFYYYFDEEYNGYLWIFPKTNYLANIGIAFYPRSKIKQNPRLMLDKILKKYGLHAIQISDYAGVIPCSGVMGKTFTSRIMVCGDAAGMVYAGTGEGIKYALKSGQFAAETAIEAVQNKKFTKNFLKRYEKMWKKSFGKDMKAGLIFFDLTVAASRIGKIRGLFRRPKEHEVRGLVLEGKVPFKARLAWRLCQLMGLTRIK